MALTKAYLIGLGVDEETAKTIMSEHGKMQATYLTQVRELEGNVTALTEAKDNEISSVTAQLTAAQLKAQELVAKHETDIKALKGEAKWSAAVDKVKPKDRSLVDLLLDKSGIDPDDKDFDIKAAELLGAIKTEKPFLFEEVPGEGEAEGNADGDDEGKKPNLSGFVPAKPGAKPEHHSTVRVGAETLPAISDIIDFDKKE
jgi:hypothetical protein